MMREFSMTMRSRRRLRASTALSGLVGFLCATSAAQAQSAASFLTPEYYASGALAQIDAASAYALGFTGRGVAIGIVDSGLDARNPEFTAAGKFLGGYNFGTSQRFLTGQNGETDTVYHHGTFVAGMAAASRDGVGMQGVAFDSGLYAMSTLNFVRSGWNDLVALGVPIINNSFGINDCSGNNGPPTPKCSIADYTAAEAAAEDPNTVAAARAAVQANTLMVFATGNETQANPDFWAGLPYRIPDLKSGWLAVGSVDASNVISSFSNRCGVAAQWCLVAPGEVASTVTVGAGTNGSNYKAGVGTSYASPVVAGVAALVKQAFPWFTNTDLQQSLLTTATPLGSRTAGSITPDAIYGWGLVNAGAAVRGYGGFVTTTTLDTLGYDSTFSNDIYGPGGLIKTGAGTLTLSGNSTYAGTTTVNGGALAVTGSIVSQVLVAAGGSLGGSGRVGSTTVQGTLGLGTPQTLTVDGNLVFGTTGVYLAGIRGPVADRVEVTGSATLAGTLRPQTLGGTYTFNTPHTILNAAAGIVGTFATFDRSLVGAGLVTTVSYTGNTVQLVLTPGKLTGLAENPSAASVTTTTNGGSTTTTVTAPTTTPVGFRSDRVRVAAAIDNAVSGGADATPVFKVFNAPSDDIGDDLEQLVGEIHTSVDEMGVQSSRLFLGAMTDSRRAGQAFAGRDIAAGPVWTAWGSLLGSLGSIDGDGALGTSRSTTHASQVVTGFDGRLAPSMLFGVALSAGNAGGRLADGLGSASADVVQVGTYGAIRSGALSLSGAAAFSWMDVTTHRAIAVLDLPDVAARYRPTLWSGRIEAAFEAVRFADVGVSPFAAFEAQTMRTPGFVERETLDGAAASGGLTVAGRTGVLNTRSVVGLDLRGGFDAWGLAVNGFARAGWAHAYAQGTSIAVSLTDVAGSDFDVAGARAKPDSAIFALGLDTRVMPNVTLTTAFDGEFAANARRVTGSARVRVAF
jgi:subtilase-type serine protease